MTGMCDFYANLVTMDEEQIPAPVSSQDLEGWLFKRRITW